MLVNTDDDELMIDDLRIFMQTMGASVVWHHSLLLINGFNKNEAAVFSCRLCFPFHQLKVNIIFSQVIL